MNKGLNKELLDSAAHHLSCATSYNNLEVIDSARKAALTAIDRLTAYLAHNPAPVVPGMHDWQAEPFDVTPDGRNVPITCTQCGKKGVAASYFPGDAMVLSSTLVESVCHA